MSDAEGDGSVPGDACRVRSPTRTPGSRSSTTMSCGPMARRASMAWSISENTAVGVVAIDDQDRVALVAQHRYTLDHRSWEIPEGGAPPGESPLAGAQRELREEAGVEATDWREIARVHIVELGDRRDRDPVPGHRAATRTRGAGVDGDRPDARIGCPSTRCSRWSSTAASPMRCRWCAHRLRDSPWNGSAVAGHEQWPGGRAAGPSMSRESGCQPDACGSGGEDRGRLCLAAPGRCRPRHRAPDGPCGPASGSRTRPRTQGPRTAAPMRMAGLRPSVNAWGVA